MSEFKAENIANKQDKIQLVSCPRKEMVCKDQLAFVNKLYVEFEQCHIDKNFLQSIEILKNAFYKTSELTEIPCSKCAVLFRSTITESMENIHAELRKMTTGIFGNKRYQYSFLMADKVLTEFKNVEISSTFQQNESKIRFLGTDLKKKVS